MKSKYKPIWRTLLAKNRPTRPAQPADEYTQLRSEVTQILSSVRTFGTVMMTMWLTVAAAFIAVVGQMSRPPSTTGQFVQWGGMNAVSCVLLTMTLILFHVTATWKSHVQVIGLYLHVFHEKGNPALCWSSLFRGSQELEIRAARRRYGSGKQLFGVSTALLSLLPAIIGTLLPHEPAGSGWNEAQRLCYSASWSALALVFVLLSWQAWRASRLSKLQPAIKAAWERERERVSADGEYAYGLVAAASDVGQAKTVGVWPAPSNIWRSACDAFDSFSCRVLTCPNWGNVRPCLRKGVRTHREPLLRPEMPLKDHRCLQKSD